jgi:hemerythrin-like domain-containing protein
MAKRLPSLVPLSHDHHHGLAIALRLRQGESALLTDGWTHDPVRQAAIVAEFYRTDLRAHFAAEEEALFPAMRREVERTVPLLERLTAEHRTLERDIEALPGVPEAGLPERLAALGALLERHIRTEERELFPAFEESVSGESAERIGLEIDRVRTHAAATAHAAVHAEAEAVLQLPTRILYGAVAGLDEYGRWWPPSARFSRAPSDAGTPVHTLAIGTLLLRLRVKDLRHDRQVALAVEGASCEGSWTWDITDFRGGRKVRCTIDLHPKAGMDCPPHEVLSGDLRDALVEALKRLPAMAEAKREGDPPWT